jgi:integrase
VDGEPQVAMSLAVRQTPFRSMELGEIRTTHVETWIKSMTVPNEKRAALAPGTIKTRFVNVRSVFRAAVRDRVIGIDPTDGVRLPRQRKRAEALSIASPEEVSRCVAVADDRFRAFIAVCALAGLRLGEAAALKFGDVDYAGVSCTCAVRCSVPGGWRVRSGCRSTGRSAPCRCRTSWP